MEGITGPSTPTLRSDTPRNVTGGRAGLGFAQAYEPEQTAAVGITISRGSTFH